MAPPGWPHQNTLRTPSTSSRPTHHNITPLSSQVPTHNTTHPPNQRRHTPLANRTTIPALRHLLVVIIMLLAWKILRDSKDSISHRRLCRWEVLHPWLDIKLGKRC